MSDFAINGVINVVTTGVDKALAEVEALEQRLRNQRGALVQEIIDGADVDRVKTINREVNAIDRELKDVKLQSRAITYNLEGMDPALRKALISADKFNRVSQNMVDNFRDGNFGDPKDLQYFRELARSADGLEDMRRALAAAEITGATVPQSLRQVVREADQFQESFGRAVQSMKDFDAVNSTRGMDELTRAMVRYNEAEARRDQANRDAGNDALTHHQRKAASDAIARYNQEMLDAERDFIRESDRLDDEAGRKRVSADREEMARRKANAQAQAMLAREEAKARAKAKSDALRDIRETHQARNMLDKDEERAYNRRVANAVKATQALQQARASELADFQRDIRARYRIQDMYDKHDASVENYRRDLGYAEMGETADQESVARRRLADATRDVTRAQTALNAARAASDDVAAARAIDMHNDAMKRHVRAQNDVARAVQFNNGLASQNRYAMYDAAQTYGMLAAIPAAGIIGLGAAAGWWESAMTNIARTSGINTFSAKGAAEMAILETQMIRMSDVIPTWVGNITDIARVGGQLGVHAKDIADFTSVVAQFTAVSDVTDIDQVSESFGRIKALTGEKSFRAIADAVTKVGVNAAATDAQILKTSQELAQAGAGANFSTQQLIGMAGGFASLGVPAERARSVMQDFVRIATGGLSGSNESMSKFAGYMGVTVDEAKSLFRTNPAQFITDFAKGLATLSPEEVVTALQDIGLKGQRAAPVFQALAKDARNAGTGMGVFASAIHDAINSEGALMEQFAPKLDDLAATWQRFLNVFSTTSAVTGKSVAPFLDDILTSTTDLMRGWRDFAGTDMGGFLIRAATAAGAAATAFFGFRAALAAAAGAGLALQSISKASGGTLRGQLAMAASAVVPSGVAERIKGVQKGAAGGVTLIPAGTAEAVTRVGAASAASATQVSRLERAAFAVRAAMDDPHGTMRAFQNGVRGVASTAASAVRTLGSSAMALAGGPLGVSALITGGAYMGIEAIGDAGSKATTELTTMVATGKSAAEVFRSAMFQDDTAKFWMGDLSEYDLNDLLPKSTTNPFQAIFGNTAGENAALRRLTSMSQAYGQIASIDMDQARQGIADFAAAQNLSADAVYAFINSDSALKESLMMSAAAAGVNIDSLDTLAGQRQLAAYATNMLVGANGDLVASEADLGALYSDTAAGLSSQVALRRENMSVLNSMTGAMGGYYQAMEGIGDVVSEYIETYGGAVDLWDESKGIWNITNADTAALATTFEGLASQTLTMADAMAEAGFTVDEVNGYIKSTRDAVAGYLDELGVSAPEIAEILNDLGLEDYDHTFTLTVDGVPESVQGVEALVSAMSEVPPGTSVTVDALTDEAIAALDEAGIYAKELSDGSYELLMTVDTGSAIGDMLQLYEIYEGLGEGESVELHIENPSEEVLGFLEGIGAEIVDLGEGVFTVVIEVEDPEGALEGLPEGPDGPILLPVEVEWDFTNADLSIYNKDTLIDLAGFEIPLEFVPDFSGVEGSAAIIAGYYNGVTGSVEINADIVDALEQIAGLEIYVNEITGEIMVVAKDDQAKQELEDFLADVEGRSANIHFDPDMDDVNEAISEATKSRDVEVEGVPQMSVAERAITRTSRPRPMTITANANVGEAERLLNRTARNRPTTISVGVSGGAAADGYLNSIARDRTSTITVNVNTNHHTTYSSSGDRGIQRGGYGVDDGMADGGYAGAGPKWAPAGIYHAGEYIIPKRDVDQTTGLPRADALARLMGQAGATGGPQVVVQQGSGGGIMELGPTSIHAIARAVQPMLKMDSNVIAQGVSSQFANNTRKGAY